MKEIFKFKRYNIFYVIVMLIVCSTIIILSNTSVNRKTMYVGKIKKYQSSSTVYKTSNDTINVLIRGTDENYLSNTLTENDVSIKVNGTIVSPSIKKLSEYKNITNGIQYTLQLFGVTGNGPLIVEVKENTLEDKAKNQNITKVYETGIIMDNTPPILGIGSAVSYFIRTDTDGNPFSPTVINEVTYGEEEKYGYPSFYNTDFSMLITNNENVSTLQYKISKQDVDNYDSITSEIIYKNYSNVTPTTKTETINLEAGSGKLGYKYFVYVKGVDKAGNIGYAKRPIYVYSKYQAFASRAYYNILDRWWLPKEGEADQWVEALYEGSTNNSFPNNYDTRWEYYGDIIKGNQKYKAIAMVLRGIYYSPEFLNKNYSNEDFVRMVYRGVLLRDEVITPSNSWIGGMNAGMGRDQILGGISSMQEAIDRYNEYNF